MLSPHQAHTVCECEFLLAAVIMLYAANDTSAEAVAWRSRGDVQYAQRFLDTNPGWLHGRRAVDLGHTRIRLSDLAFGFEVGLGPVKHPVKVPAGIGVTSFGVYSEQSVTDAAMLHELLWRVQPSLVVEVGTMCGGSATWAVPSNQRTS